MIDKKMTAVEWLQYKISEMERTHYFNLDQLIKQAKEIDKQQRIEDMDKMQIISDVDFDGNVTFIFNPEQYYKETYENG
jgi:hypothetical protein